MQYCDDCAKLTGGDCGKHWQGVKETVQEPIRQGWQCPVCKVVWSPDQSGCIYCNYGK